MDLKVGDFGLATKL